MCGLIVLNRLPINFSPAWTFLLWPSPQASAVRLCPSAWSGESSHAKDMQLISVARGVMSSWSRRPTTAGPMTRSATLTLSRWRTSTATSPMPTRLYHKGKTQGSAGISFHQLDQELRTPPPPQHTQKKPKRLHLPCFYGHLLAGELTDTFFCWPRTPSSSWWCGRRFDAQKTGSHINSWQAGIDIREQELFTPAALCRRHLTHDQRCPETASRTTSS